MWEVDSGWFKAHTIHNGLFDLIILNYMVYIQAVHRLVKHTQSYKIYFIEDRLSVYNTRTDYFTS